MDDGKDGPMWPFYVQQLFIVRTLKLCSSEARKWIDDRLGVLGHMGWQLVNPIDETDSRCLFDICGLTRRGNDSQPCK
jgi:hypothetical protein